MAGEELNEEPKIQILNDFIQKKIIFYNEYVKSLSPFIQPNTEMLNDVFKQTLDEAWKDSSRL